MAYVNLATGEIVLTSDADTDAFLALLRSAPKTKPAAKTAKTKEVAKA